jgi:hypothetical protein
MRTLDGMTFDAKVKLAAAAALAVVIVWWSWDILGFDLAGVWPLAWVAAGAFLVALAAAVYGHFAEARREEKERRLDGQLGEAIRQAERIGKKARRLSERGSIDGTDPS